MNELSAKNFGLAIGLVWGVSCFLLALIGTKTGLGIGVINSLGTMYIGYGEGLVGSLFGLVYGFLDGFIGGFCIAYVYNMFSK